MFQNHLETCQYEKRLCDIINATESKNCRHVEDFCIRILNYAPKSSWNLLIRNHSVCTLSGRPILLNNMVPWHNWGLQWYNGSDYTALPPHHRTNGEDGSSGQPYELHGFLWFRTCICIIMDMHNYGYVSLSCNLGCDFRIAPHLPSLHRDDPLRQDHLESPTTL